MVCLATVHYSFIHELLVSRPKFCTTHGRAGAVRQSDGLARLLTEAGLLVPLTAYSRWRAGTLQLGGRPYRSLCGSCRGYPLKSRQGWIWIDLPPTFDGLRLHVCLGRFQDFTSLDERFIYGEDICLGVLKKLYQQDFIKSTKQGFIKPTK